PPRRSSDLVHALGRLVAHPLDDRDARVTEDHERVVDVADDAGELQLENGVESGDDALPLDRVVFAGHGGLLLFGSYHPGGGPASRMMNFWWKILGLKSIVESTAPRRSLTKSVRLVSRETTAVGGSTGFDSTR